MSDSKIIKFPRRPNRISVVVHTLEATFADRIQRATNPEGWTDVAALCSCYVVDVLGRTGYSQDALNECARVVSRNLWRHGFGLSVHFQLVTAEAVSIQVMARPRPQGGE